MPATFGFEAIGTAWKINIHEELSAERQAALLASIMERIETFDRTYSRFRDDSTITEMSKRAGTFELPEDAGPMLDVYRKLYDATSGAFTPLIGQVMSDAGYDAAYSLVSKPLSKPPAWDDVMVISTLPLKTKFPLLVGRRGQGWSPRVIVSSTCPVLLDFGAAGKGYLVDLVAELIESHGIASFCVDAGGDMICRGPVPTRVGLENPLATDEAIGIATIQNASICGSSGNRRAWGEFHHTIDPRTLASPRHILATWTIASTALVADAIATCLFLVPAEDLKSVYTFDYVILFADGSVERSSSAPVELFIE